MSDTETRAHTGAMIVKGALVKALFVVGFGVLFVGVVVSPGPKCSHHHCGSSRVSTLTQSR